MTSTTERTIAPLRYELPYVSPSAVADQMYCEYKVHLAHTHPEVIVAVEAIEAGEQGHASLVADAEPITPEEIEKAVAAGRQLVVCEWTLEGIVHDVTLRGRPDLLSVADLPSPKRELGRFLRQPVVGEITEQQQRVGFGLERGGEYRLQRASRALAVVEISDSREPDEVLGCRRHAKPPAGTWFAS